MESINHLSALVAELHVHSHQVPQAQLPSLPTSQPSGFFQQIFYHSILSHFNMIALTTKYHDLPKSFDFYHHHTQQDCTNHPSQNDTHQAAANY